MTERDRCRVGIAPCAIGADLQLSAAELKSGDYGITIVPW
jgi:hypothetical protein